MKKGIIGLLTLASVFSFATIINNQKVEAESVTTTFDYTAQNYANADVATTLTKDGVTVEWSKGTNSNAPKYYNDGTAVRAYSGNTFSISSEAGAIYKVNITFGSSDGSNEITTNVGTFDTSVWTGSADSIIFTIGGTSGNRRIRKIEVSYNEGEAPVAKTPTEEVNDLLKSYYNKGNYLRHTEINLNKGVKEELIKCFHAESNLLIRDTYFVDNELWMQNDAGSYSYYGSKDGNMTSARTEKPLYQPKSISTAIKNTSMEDYYTTMYDIQANSATWTKNGSVYSTNDATVVKMFLDFTAPCFLGLSGDKANYFSLDHVEVEEIESSLKLRLVTTGDIGKLSDENGVLSVATITKENNKVTVTNIADTLIAENNTPVELIGTVDSFYPSGNKSFFIKDENGNNILVFSPTTNETITLDSKVKVNGLKTTFSGNTQIASGSKIEILESQNYEEKTYVKSISELIAIGNELSTNYVSRDNYTVSGTVTKTGDSFYLTNESDSILLYGSTEGIHDGCQLTITGKLYNFKDETLELIEYSIDEIISAKFNVTVECDINGSYELSKSSDIVYGESVTLTTKPNSTYVVDYVKVNGFTISATSENVYNVPVLSMTSITISFKSVDAEEPTLYTVTASYTGSTTHNMDSENNNAEILGLDSNIFDVSTNKNKSSNEVGLNKEGTIRLYADKTNGNGCELTISAPGKTIVSIKITLKSTTHGDFTVNGITGVKSTTVYDINSESVTIKNVHIGATTQVYIKSIEITYK